MEEHPVQSPPPGDPASLACPRSPNPRIRPIFLGLIAFLAPLAIGWPYLGAHGSITPDGVDYINIARNLE